MLNHFIQINKVFASDKPPFLSQVETKPNFPDKIQAYSAGVPHNESLKLHRNLYKKK